MECSSSLATSLTLVVVLLVLGTAAITQTEARAFFVFGDSLVDNGNNNYLATSARADSYPYGIDYPTHRATGRFSNGKNIPDLISEAIGAEPTLPYLSPQLTGQRLLVGANFASAGIGILNDTGIQFIKKLDYGYVVNTVKSKLNMWKAKCLSQAARTTLIESVSSAIPIYQISSALLLKTMLDSLDKLQRDFWQGYNSKGKLKSHLTTWDTITAPRVHDGLNIRQFYLHNLAMLGKYTWKFLTEPESFVTKFFKAKYFPHNSFLHCTIRSLDSRFWKDVICARDALKPFLGWTISQGTEVNIWQDNWIPTLQGFKPISATAVQQHHPDIQWVAQLIDPHSRFWNGLLLN
ncbi:hypothetical protein GIB67_024579 [Kingdonia uniflora]|uniref:GDSL esterase/lipase n=1 Tax=Kingdonia uniflora TaxID=39325 RepID=A0A7J7LP67_9MAGN|nr:hypothetical protein GIB67_024579 [Kingdonia uniflora]